MLTNHLHVIQSKFRGPEVYRRWWDSSWPEHRAADFAEFDPAGESERRLAGCIYRQYHTEKDLE